MAKNRNALFHIEEATPIFTAIETKPMKITATIVIYCPRMEWLMKSIHSFIEKENFNRKLYLIDNSPVRNKELESFENNQIEYIFNNRNIGFGKAHNLGIKKAIAECSDFHLILNPDVQFDTDVITELVAVLNQNEAIGLISPKIIYPNGTTQHLCKLLANPLDLIFRRFSPFKKWNERINSRYELRFTGYNETMQVPSLSGCFMLMPTRILKKVNGFDERFFLYCEDFDLCRRIGGISQTIFYPNVSVIHNYEKGSYKNVRLLFLHVISAIKYFNKWGWFFDRERRKVNKQTLNKLGYHRHSVKIH